MDTNVLSASAPQKSDAAPGLLNWMDSNSQLLYLSVITLAEVEGGIAKARREGATWKVGRLSAWLETVLHLYSSRILPVDVPTARVLDSGQSPGLADLAIAATAKYQRFTVMMRNMKHFRHLGVSAHDPFLSLPP